MNRYLLSIASSLTISILVVTTGTMAATHRSNTDILLTRKLNCDRPQTQREMNECAAIAYQAADQKLNQVYQELKAALPDYRQPKLVTAQQVWINFRDANCEFEKSAVEGGSLAPTIYYNCLSQLTEQRTKELQGYFDATRN